MDISQKRREEARWSILRILHAGRPIGLSETIVARVLADTKLDATQDGVRRELDYLSGLGLVEVSELEDGTWYARLMAEGVAVIEYTTASPAGIARPATGNL